MGGVEVKCPTTHHQLPATAADHVRDILWAALRQPPESQASRAARLADTRCCYESSRIGEGKSQNRRTHGGMRVSFVTPAPTECGSRPP